MSGGGGGASTAAPRIMTQEEAEKSSLLKEKEDLAVYSNFFDRAMKRNVSYQGDPEKIAQIDKRISELDRTSALKSIAGEGFQEIGKGDKSISTASSTFKEIGTEDITADDVSKKKSDNGNLDAQRASLGDRRRQSLFSTQNSRSLLG